MSGHKYIPDTKNLFLDDDVDDNTFLRNSRLPPPTSSSYVNSYSDFVDPQKRLEDQRQSLIEKRREIEENTIRSTQKSLGLLRESEQVGIATAEELQRQREKLELTDKRLDEINSTLRFSQKHLNGIKSVFGSLKNYLSGKNAEPQPSSSVNKHQSGSNISPSGSRNSNLNHIDNTASQDLYSTHPLTRIRESDNEFKAPKNDVSNAQAIIDANLEEMLNSTICLKSLAIDLSQELDSQNDLIDNITYKTDKADLNINKQNKEMNKILKK